MYGTSSPPSALDQAYGENASYQIPASPPKADVLASLAPTSPASPSSLPGPEALAARQKFLGKGPNYSSFVAYFLSEIRRLGGIPEALNAHLFSGGEVAEDLLVRLHAGFLHPLIHLMYGIEFSVPEVVAQALAQAAVHKDTLREFFWGAEEMARARARGEGMGRIEDLYGKVRGDKKLAGSARFSDEQKITDGVLARAKGEMLYVAAQVKVGEGEVDERMWEMYENAVFGTLGSSGFMERKKEKCDFFLM